MTTKLKPRPSAGTHYVSAHDADFSWDILCSRIARVFRLNDAETKRLYASGTARLIATLPFAAGCDEAERTAFGHLCLYAAELRAEHGPGDHSGDDEVSLMTRLRMLTNFKGGDERVIDHGMRLLALVMIEGYYRSRDSDAARGIANPFANGSWDYESLKARLIREIESSPCERLDEILPFQDSTLWVW